MRGRVDRGGRGISTSSRRTLFTRVEGDRNFREGERPPAPPPLRVAAIGRARRMIVSEKAGYASAERDEMGDRGAGSRKGIKSAKRATRGSRLRRQGGRVSFAEISSPPRPKVRSNSDNRPDPAHRLHREVKLYRRLTTSTREEKKSSNPIRSSISLSLYLPVSTFLFSLSLRLSFSLAISDPRRCINKRVSSVHLWNFAYATMTYGPVPAY